MKLRRITTAAAIATAVLLGAPSTSAGAEPDPTSLAPTTMTNGYLGNGCVAGNRLTKGDWFGIITGFNNRGNRIYAVNVDLICLGEGDATHAFTIVNNNPKIRSVPVTSHFRAAVGREVKAPELMSAAAAEPLVALMRVDSRGRITALDAIPLWILQMDLSTLALSEPRLAAAAR